MISLIIKCWELIIFIYLEMAIIIAKSVQSIILKAFYRFEKTFLYPKWVKEEICRNGSVRYRNCKQIKGIGCPSTTTYFSDQMTQTYTINHKPNATKKLDIELEPGTLKTTRNPHNSQYSDAKMKYMAASAKTECLDPSKSQYNISSSSDMSIEHDVSNANILLSPTTNTCTKKSTFTEDCSVDTQRLLITNNQKIDYSLNYQETIVENNFSRTLKLNKAIYSQNDSDAPKVSVKHLSGLNFNSSIYSKQVINQSLNEFQSMLEEMQKSYEISQQNVNNAKFSFIDDCESSEIIINGSPTNVSTFFDPLESISPIKKLDVLEVGVNLETKMKINDPKCNDLKKMCTKVSVEKNNENTLSSFLDKQRQLSDKGSNQSPHTASNFIKLQNEINNVNNAPKTKQIQSLYVSEMDKKESLSCSSYESLPIIEDTINDWNKSTSILWEDAFLPDISNVVKEYQSIESNVFVPKLIADKISATVSHNSKENGGSSRMLCCDIIEHTVNKPLNENNKMTSEENAEMPINDEYPHERSSELQNFDCLILKNSQINEPIEEPKGEPENKVAIDSSEINNEPDILKMEYQNYTDSKVPIIVETYTIPVPPGKEEFIGEVSTTMWYLVGGSVYCKKNLDEEHYEAMFLQPSEMNNEPDILRMEYQNYTDSKVPFIVETYTIPVRPGKEAFIGKVKTTMWYLVGGSVYCKKNIEEHYEGLNLAKHWDKLAEIITLNFLPLNSDTYIKKLCKYICEPPE